MLGWADSAPHLLQYLHEYLGPRAFSYVSKVRASRLGNSISTQVLISSSTKDSFSAQVCYNDAIYLAFFHTFL